MMARHASGSPGRCGGRRHRPEPASDARRVEALAREHFRLSPFAPVRVAEASTALPGFPPVETLISFWSGNRDEHLWRVFKPMAQVTRDDLPPWWMKDALMIDEAPFCDCCG